MITFFDDKFVRALNMTIEIADKSLISERFPKHVRSVFHKLCDELILHILEMPDTLDLVLLRRK
jgi:hypothetical protein